MAFDDVPVDRRWIYNRRGHLLPLTHPRWAPPDPPSGQDARFCISHYVVQQNHGNAARQEMSDAITQLDGWLESVGNIDSKNEDHERLVKFTKAIRQRLVRAVDGYDGSPYKHQEIVLICRLECPDTASPWHHRLVGCTWCMSAIYHSDDLAVLASAVDPQLLPGGRDAGRLKGTGRVMKQAVINIMEAGDRFDYVTSWAVDRVSSYINASLGFDIFEIPESQP